MWAYLIHLSYNMWGDRNVPGLQYPYWERKPYLRCDRATWDDLVARMADAGVTHVVIDVGDGVRFESRPEIGVEGAWTPDELTEALDRIRSLGMAPVPKLNFSACHDAWMGDYARMLSTPAYYAVCRDLIAETARIFGNPAYFHLGMDEEDLANQRHFRFVTIRQYDLWWNDLRFLVNEAEERGARAWVWSDFAWSHPEEFAAQMPRTVLQSNWYYNDDFAPNDPAVQAYAQLDAAGFDQAPAGSVWASPTNFVRTVEHCRRVIAPERLVGFLQTVWKPTLPETLAIHAEAIRQVAAGRQAWASCR
jgi:hypothetical protein